MGFKKRAPVTTFQKVKKMVLARVQAAVDTGKTVSHNGYMVHIGGRVHCCALGAIALNGQKDTTVSVYEVTAPLLMKAGVPENEVGFVMDAIEFGFEGTTISANGEYPDTDPTDDANWQEHFLLRKKWLSYVDLGRFVGKLFCKTNDPDEPVAIEELETAKEEARTPA